MKRMRRYMGWWMLLAAVTFAVPRTWLHSCGENAGLHMDHADEGDHDHHLDHGTCQFCDFAATPSLQPLTAVVLVAPEWRVMEDNIAEQTTYSTSLRLADLRGPPTV